MRFTESQCIKAMWAESKPQGISTSTPPSPKTTGPQKQEGKMYYYDVSTVHLKYLHSKPAANTLAFSLKYQQKAFVALYLVSLVKWCPLTWDKCWFVSCFPRKEKVVQLNCFHRWAGGNREATYHVYLVICSSVKEKECNPVLGPCFIHHSGNCVILSNLHTNVCLTPEDTLSQIKLNYLHTFKAPLTTKDYHFFLV